MCWSLAFWPTGAEHLRMQHLLAGIDELDEALHPAGEGEVVGLVVALVDQADAHAVVEEAQLAQALRQDVVVEVDVREDLEVGQEVDLGAALLGLAGDLHRRDEDAVALLDQPVLGHALAELHRVGQAVAADDQAQPLRQAVDAAHADAVQPARDLVAVLVELAAGMQLGQRDLGGRALRLVLVVELHAGRDAAAVVDHRDRVVGVDGDDDVVAEARKRLVDRVVDHLEHEVVQAGAVGRVADVHARTLAHRLQALQDLDRAFAVGVASFSRARAFAQLIGRPAGWSRPCSPCRRGCRRSRASCRCRRLLESSMVLPRRQIRIGITTYLKPAWSGTVIRALELVSWSSTVTISWPMLVRASIR